MTSRVLDDLTCRRLLSTSPAGTLAFTRQALPAVAKVRLEEWADELAFYIEDKDRGGVNLDGQVVCVQSNQADGSTVRWTVSVTGMAHQRDGSIDGTTRIVVEPVLVSGRLDEGRAQAA